MHRKILPLLAIMSLQTVLPARAADSDIVARMGNITLTLEDARRLVGKSPADAQSPEAIERMLRTEVVRRALARQARSQSFDKRPEVAQRMEQAAEQALVAAYMNDRARPDKDFPSETEIRQAYEANKAQFTTQRQYRVSQIYVAGADKAAADKADDLHAQALRQKSGFAEIARKSSQHKASAELGGDMGWLAEASLVPAVRSALTQLKKGEISKPVAGSEGYHILMLADLRQPELLPLDKVKPLLVQNLRLRKAAELEAAYIDGLLAKTPVAVNNISLDELAKPVKK